MGLTQKELADHLGCDLMAVNRIVNGKTSVTAKMPVELRCYARNYFGSMGSFSGMRFHEADSKQSNEKFEGTYLFLTSGVKAIKHWYDSESFGRAGARPRFMTYQEGLYIAEADY